MFCSRRWEWISIVVRIRIYLPWQCTSIWPLMDWAKNIACVLFSRGYFVVAESEIKRKEKKRKRRREYEGRRVKIPEDNERKDNTRFPEELLGCKAVMSDDRSWYGFSSGRRQREGKGEGYVMAKLFSFETLLPSLLQPTTMAYDCQEFHCFDITLARMITCSWFLRIRIKANNLKVREIIKITISKVTSKNKREI